MRSYNELHALRAEVLQILDEYKLFNGFDTIEDCDGTRVDLTRFDFVRIMVSMATYGTSKPNHFMAYTASQGNSIYLYTSYGQLRVTYNKKNDDANDILKDILYGN